MTTVDAVELEAYEYLTGVMAGLQALDDPGPRLPHRDLDALADEIFELVTSRRFCYLSRSKTAPYRTDTVRLLRRRLGTSGPLRFFYDIGPGYHASLVPGELGLRFGVGLSELLILAQIDAVCRAVSSLYAPGARFYLVVDNLCALRTNDIPLESTRAYCADLRRLIHETALERRVELLVESEQFTLEEYDGLLAAVEPRPLPDTVDPAAAENVERFLGRRCTAREAAERLELYRRTTAVTDRLFDRLVEDVHMTQRATGATLGFRPFPGGDSRTQAGEVVLGPNRNGRLHPFLLTSRNAAAWTLDRVRVPELLPPSVPHVLLATRRVV